MNSSAYARVRAKLIACNDRGTDHFEAGRYRQALPEYQEALHLCLTASSLPHANIDELERFARLIYDNLGFTRYALGMYAAATRALLRALDGAGEATEVTLRYLVASLAASCRFLDAARYLRQLESDYSPHPDGITHTLLMEADDDQRLSAMLRIPR